MGAFPKRLADAMDSGSIFKQGHGLLDETTKEGHELARAIEMAAGFLVMANTTLENASARPWAKVSDAASVQAMLSTADATTRTVAGTLQDLLGHPGSSRSMCLALARSLVEREYGRQQFEHEVYTSES